MRLGTCFGLAGVLCVILPVALSAAPQVPYPAKGQSPQTQESDQRECSTWAIEQTGFDPAAPPPQLAPPPTQVTGTGARARGAAAGAIVGGVSGGDAGEAAVAGAVVGGMAQRGRNRRAANAQQQAVAQQVGAGQAAYAQARSACLSGRGYTMK